MSDRPLIDARPDHLDIVREILRRHMPERKVWAFGSRVTWTARTYSDLDLVILGDEPLDLGMLASLKEDFSESDLPWKVDVVDWAGTSGSFRKIIRKNKVELRLGEEQEKICLEEIITFNPTIRLTKGHIAPFIDMASLPTVDRYIPTITEKTFSGSGVKFEDGDTLFARITPCLENGKGGFVRGLGNGVVAHGSTEFIVFRAKHSSDEEFAYYISRLPEFRLFAEKQMSGTSGRQRVSWQSLKNFNIFDIKSYERTAIASVLGSLDNKIDLNRRMNETLEEMARALFRDWFVDFGPTCAKMEGREPYLAQEIWDQFPGKLDDEGKPEGWKTQSVIDQADWINGAAYKNMHFSEAPDALPVVKIAELKAGVTAKTKHTNTALGDKYRIADGELLFSWSGNPDTSIDTFIWTGGDAWLNQHIFAVRNNGEMSPTFLYTMLRWLKPEFAEIARNKQTTGLGHVTKQDLKRMQISVGTPEILSAFENIAGHIHSRFRTNLFENKTLAQTRDLLLPKFMSGEIRVRDAEKAVEAVA